MNIHQLSVNYIQEHDRILVRINTTASEELRLWFTRRLTLNLLPMVQKIVAEWIAKQEAVKSASISPTAAADAQTLLTVLAQIFAELLTQAQQPGVVGEKEQGSLPG